MKNPYSYETEFDQWVAYSEGKQDGIREVVKWIRNSGTHKDGLSHYCPNCDHTIMGVADYLWQAKLKGWGI